MNVHFGALLMLSLLTGPAHSADVREHREASPPGARDCAGVRSVGNPLCASGATRGHVDPVVPELDTSSIVGMVGGILAFLWCARRIGDRPYYREHYEPPMASST